jgi:hypothetical protein
MSQMPVCLGDMFTSGIVVMLFYGGTSPPGKIMAKYLKRIEDIKLLEIDIEDAGKGNKNFAYQNNVKFFPTTCIFLNGKLQHSIMGLIEEEELSVIMDKIRSVR